MASYAVIGGNDVATGGSAVLAVVVTDGQVTEVYGDSDVASSLREDVDWGTGPEVDVLRLGLTGLSYFTIDGPHTFAGDARTAGPVLARSYGVA